MKKVLFVCLSNARRSQMAEAIFNNTSKWKAKSAGIEPGEKVDENVIRVLKEMGVETDRLRPKGVTDALLEEADKIITFRVADKIPDRFRNKVVDWRVGAESMSKLQEMYSIEYLREIRDLIYKKVQGLIDDLKSEGIP